VASVDISTNGIRVRLHIWDRSQQQVPLLLLHSAGESAATWFDLADQWSMSRTVYAIDLRGHGHSERTARYSLELMRDDVHGVLDTLALDQVDVIGHSLGGMVAYLLASQGRDEIRRIVLEEAPPPLPLIPPRPIPDNPGKDLGFDWQVITDLYPQRNNPDPTWWDELQRIDQPVLTLAGGPQSHIDQDQLKRMSDRIPNATITTIESGHNIHQTQPEGFTAAVSDFLGRQDLSGA